MKQGVSRAREESEFPLEASSVAESGVKPVEPGCLQAGGSLLASFSARLFIQDRSSDMLVPGILELSQAHNRLLRVDGVRKLLADIEGLLCPYAL